MEVLLKCLDLNTQAIVCMKEGRVVESSLILRTALEKLEGCFAPLPQYCVCPRVHARNVQAPYHGAVTDSGVGTYVLSPSGRGGCSYISVSIERQWTKNIAKISPDNVFSFYPRAFDITCHGDIDAMELMKITMIIMFNEAVSRHAVTLMYLSLHKVHPDIHLRSVLSLYQKIVVHAQRCFQYNDVHEMLCVLVAAANNYGHIASQLLLFDETRDSISNMINLLAISDGNSFLHDDVRLFFESVCIFLEGHNLCNAPAA
jgi:hypothetical protein